jgi:hypothetical protein
MNPPINFARSIGAVIIGFIVLAGTDTIITALVLKFFFGSLTAPLTINQTIGLLAVKVVSGLAAGYITATLAVTRRWQHALVLAGIVLTIGLVGLLLITAAPRSAYTNYALILSPLSIVLGGWLRHRKAA